MEARMDLFDKLGPDLSSEILTYLEDPSDLVRASFVSRSWRHCGELKQLNVFLVMHTTMVVIVFLFSFFFFIDK
jgi:hypothetical protein